MKSLGQIAFEAYAKEKEGLTHDGRIIPPWEEVGDEVRAAWERAAHAVMDALEAQPLYPYADGDTTVLGPQVIAYASAINWRGAHYELRPDA